MHDIKIIMYRKPEPPEDLLCALQIGRLGQGIPQVQVSCHLPLHSEEVSLENKMKTESLPLK
jgi:hypothetical protein